MNAGASRNVRNFSKASYRRGNPDIYPDRRRVFFNGTVPRTISVIAQTLAERGDPKAIYLGEVPVELVP